MNTGISVVALIVILGIALNFVLVILAILITVKWYNKMFITIIDECEEYDKQQIFMDFWKKHER